MWFSRYFTARYWTARYFSATGEDIIIIPADKINTEGFFVSASNTGNFKALTTIGKFR